MGLENAEFIAELNILWPLGTDYRIYGDDHLRMIKEMLKSHQFPNFTGEAITLTEAEVNSVLDRILRAGDTMIGRLHLPLQVPASDNEAVHKKWVDDYYQGLLAGTCGDFAWGVTEKYTSNEFNFDSTKQDSIAHVLTAVPEFFSGKLICKTIDAGYAVGDTVTIGGAQSNDTDSSTEVGGIDIWVSSTEIGYSAGAKVWVNHKSTGAFTEITEASWRLILTAMRIE